MKVPDLPTWLSALQGLSQPGGELCLVVVVELLLYQALLGAAHRLSQSHHPAIPGKIRIEMYRTGLCGALIMIQGPREACLLRKHTWPLLSDALITEPLVIRQICIRFLEEHPKLDCIVHDTDSQQEFVTVMKITMADWCAFPGSSRTLCSEDRKTKFGFSIAEFLYQ